MSTIYQENQPNTKLILFDKSKLPLTVQTVELKLLQKNGIPSECHLTFQVSPELYQRIDTEAFFHLSPELRGSFPGQSFQPEANIEITATLQPQLLPSLSEHATDSQAAIAYLSSLSQTFSNQESDRTPASDREPSKINDTKGSAQPNAPNPLLLTESWFALHVKQQQETGETGYRTFWSYVKPTIIGQEVDSGGQVSTAIGQFFQAWAESDKPTEATISEALDELFQDLEAWADDGFLSSAEEAISDIVNEFTHSFETWLNPNKTSETPTVTKKSIYQAMITFFSEDDWAFSKLKGESTLRLPFQGEHGQWNCYALARDELSQFIFYSICPVVVPDNKRLAIAEFITRVNYGLLPGNFELNFDSGEIRYKTNLDTTHLSIRSSIIKQLVYTNVTIMDHYLPGILAVIEQDMEPKDVIQSIRGSEP